MLASFCCCLWRSYRTCHKEQGTVSQPLAVFNFRALKFFDWLIILLLLPIPFTLFPLNRKRQKRKRNRKKKKLFWSFWFRFRRASDSTFLFTLDRNAPRASDSVASVNQPLVCRARSKIEDGAKLTAWKLERPARLTPSVYAVFFCCLFLHDN